MKYFRSRPWRSRGPWFSNRAGSRRRGRRDDEGVVAAAVDIPIQDEIGFVQEGSAAVQDIVEDVLLPVAGAWPIPERMRAAWVDDGHGLTRPPGPRIEQVADAVVAADVLARQSDDTSSASRQSA